MYKIVSMLVLILMSVGALAEDGWESVAKAKAPGEVSTWLRSVKGAQVKEFRGVVDLPQAPLRVLLALDNVEAFPDWVFRCKHAERIVGRGVYLRFGGIWPASDRDATVSSEASILADRVLIRTTVAGDLKPEQKGYVRIPRLDNRFEVVPLPDGGSRVIFQTFVDPGGILPAFISNMVARQGPLETLGDLKRHLDENAIDAQSVESLSRIYTPVRAELAAFLKRFPAAMQ